MPVCPACSAQIAAGARYCPSCGAAAPQPDDNNPYRASQAADAPPQIPRQRSYPPGTVPTYLVQAILVAICCCQPFGIVSIVYAAQVNGKLQAGDLAGAQQSSRNAKMWAWIGFAAGIAVGLIWGGLQAVLVANGGMR